MEGLFSTTIISQPYSSKSISKIIFFIPSLPLLPLNVITNIHPYICPLSPHFLNNLHLQYPARSSPAFRTVFKPLHTIEFIYPISFPIQPIVLVLTSQLFIEDTTYKSPSVLEKLGILSPSPLQAHIDNHIILLYSFNHSSCSLYLPNFQFSRALPTSNDIFSSNLISKILAYSTISAYIRAHKAS